MANTSSAKKAIRSTAKKAIFNLRRRRSMREARNEVLKAVASKDKKAAAKAIPVAQKAIDKAAKNGVIHKATASRYKSRLAEKVKSLG